MTDWSSASAVVFASFAASLVEFVEALTVILAVGAVRGWRSALLGTALGLGALMILVVLAGRSMTNIPLAATQLVLGTLLLLFGLRWLHKAILRSAGTVRLHDEEAAYASQVDALRDGIRGAEGGFDSVGVAAAFKIVMLEGIEVVFIVLALGVGSNSIIPAASGAALGLVVVATLGVALHRPLSRIPENTLKFGVGVVLCAFGAFWTGEGIGLNWPGQDWAIFALVAGFLSVALVLIRVRSRFFRSHRPAPARHADPAGPFAIASHKLTGLFVEDLGLAVGVVCWVGVWRMIPVTQSLATWAANVSFVMGLIVLLAFSVVRGAGS